MLLGIQSEPILSDFFWKENAQQIKENQTQLQKNLYIISMVASRKLKQSHLINERDRVKYKRSSALTLIQPGGKWPFSIIIISRDQILGHKVTFQSMKET